MGAQERRHKTWKFALYVTGDTPRTASAISNLKRICDSYLGKDYAIEVIDMLAHPEASRQRQILAVPTTIRTYPLPERRVIGDLSSTDQVVAFLELPARHAKKTRRPDHPC